MKTPIAFPSVFSGVYLGCMHIILLSCSTSYPITFFCVEGKGSGGAYRFFETPKNSAETAIENDLFTQTANKLAIVGNLHTPPSTSKPR